MKSIITSSSEGVIDDSTDANSNEKASVNQSISERIRSRLLERNISFFANDNVAECILDGEL